jgi:diadenosine tetraphosphate (Ap4A) HIT family hydrolase
VQNHAECFICRKHAGLEAEPPGGYLYDDAHFRICHAPAAMALPGALLIESRRHVLDFAAMTPDEAADYGALLSRVYAAVKRVTGAERVYTLVTLEGGSAAHFHSWHVPRLPGATARGVTLLAQDHSCSEDEALAAAEALREALR